jgi:hypothetical protein
MIQSTDNIYAAFSAGRQRRQSFNKITGAAAYSAGRWYEMLSLAGNPVATTFPGTALACVNCTDASGDGTNKFGIQHGGDVSAQIKQLFKMGLMSTAATGVPTTLKLIDVVSYWPGINMNTGSAQTLTGTPTLTRYPNGENLKLALAIRTTSGGSAHTLALSYTNQEGTSGRALGATVACTASAITPHICHTGLAANNFGPDLPLSSGDTGVQNVASLTLSAPSGAGTGVLILYRDLEDITISIANYKVDKDFVYQFPSGTIIPNGACLGAFQFAGANTAANTNFYGEIQTAWG